MELIIALIATVAVLGFVFALVALSRLNTFIQNNEHRAYVQSVLHAVEVRGEVDRQERNR